MVSVELISSGYNLQKAATLAQKACDASAAGNHQAVTALVAASKESLCEAKRASDNHLLITKANDET